MSLISIPRLAFRALRVTALVTGLVVGFTSPAIASTYTKTQYPIVLVHGMLGFDAIGPLNYFYQIPGALRDGGSVVFTPSVSATNSSEVRGEQLLKYLRSLRAAYGYQKFNLIGHSHGGPTTRYVAAVAPDIVASVTTVASPNTGSKVADGLAKVSDGTGTRTLIVKVTEALAIFISFLSGEPGLPQDAIGTLGSLSTPGAAEFNRRFSDGAPTSRCGQGPASVNGVRYYSAGGYRTFPEAFSVSDVLLGLTGQFFGSEPNDGLVSQCSSHWGAVVKDSYIWNHLEAVNQPFGMRSFWIQDPVAFYRSHANRLKAVGL